jgi:hypothetical protein
MSNHLIRHALLLSFAPCALILPLAAQGSDNCATPTVITGQGSFGFNNGSATTGTQGQNESLCDAFGTTGISNDVWFTWTANADGQATMTMCGGSSFDTKIAAYSGSGCPTSSALACDDDFCGVQSEIIFTVVNGDTYTLQVGNFPGATGGAGMFSLTIGSGPPACGNNTGPDVIVGDLTDVMNVAPLGGIDAIAIGTESCNIGTQVVNWIGGTNDHPVIRQNLYRYKIVDGAGRFEQVGMSWVKHGFASLQESLCCTCQPGGDGSHLGVGCADPYTAGLNGSQAALGPNWEVNAHTGVFAYPPSDPSHGNDSIYRLCQVALTDLEVTGSGNTTRFFGEGHYVTKDDAAAGNQNNNASWREMSVTGNSTNYNLELIGSTNRGRSAIHAWSQIDSGVGLQEVQVPGDGLIILGTRATDLGTGLWRYEYAVYNMNADRDVGYVAVPITPGVTVSNIGFHDVSYHDGDGPGNVNFTGTDWPSSQSSGVLTWACELEAQNPSANAIRWGTLYNFRYDADSPPTQGPITVGLWKSGSPPSVSAQGDVPGGRSTGSPFCFGDGAVVPCPCLNIGTSGHGCNNSAGTGGALLSGSGTPSVTSDTLHFTCSDELPNVLSILLQGDATIVPLNFGDGLRCTGGNLFRLFVHNAVGGVVSMPAPGDLSVSQRSATLGDSIPAGGTRYYQVYYRDPDLPFCPAPQGDAFNASGAVAITWGS